MVSGHSVWSIIAEAIWSFISSRVCSFMELLFTCTCRSCLVSAMFATWRCVGYCACSCIWMYGTVSTLQPLPSSCFYVFAVIVMHASGCGYQAACLKIFVKRGDRCTVFCQPRNSQIDFYQLVPRYWRRSASERVRTHLWKTQLLRSMSASVILFSKLI